MGGGLSRQEGSKVVDRTGNGICAAASCAINGFRESMEDAHCMVLPQNPQGVGRHIFGVFDGHSNETCSAFIAEHLPPLLNNLAVDATNEQIENVFIAADAAYMEDDRGGGTTGTVCIIDVVSPQQMMATICNTGDSRVTIIRNNELLFVTHDHKPSSADERERIERAGGMVRMNRVDGELAVSRAFGDSQFKRSRQDPRATKVICVPDITRVPLQPNDIVLLCCDGVYEGNFTDEQVVDFTGRQYAAARPAAFVEAQIPLDDAVVAANICDQAIRRGSKDNISSMVVRIGVDGTNVTRQFGEHSFCPGPPPLRNNNAALNAFEAMARMAGYNVGQAVKRRYELIRARAANALVPPNFNELDTHAFDLQDSLDLDGEERYYGNGPPADLAGDALLQWFQSLTSAAPVTAEMMGAASASQ